MKKRPPQASWTLYDRLLLGTAVMLSTITCGLAFVAWAQMHNWALERLSPYEIFPLLGLIAFSLLWSQYMTLAIERFAETAREILQPFFRVSGFLVLVALLLHPGLLIWQLWRDGFGLPPESYLTHFVAPGLGWAALLGTASLFIFLTYEFKRVFANRPWWLWVVYACDVAMLAVFYHGLRLGGQLQAGWFKNLWIGYGILLVIALAYMRSHDYCKHRRKVNFINQ